MRNSQSFNTRICYTANGSLQRTRLTAGDFAILEENTYLWRIFVHWKENCHVNESDYSQRNGMDDCMMPFMSEFSPAEVLTELEMRNVQRLEFKDIAHARIMLFNDPSWEDTVSNCLACLDADFYQCVLMDNSTGVLKKFTRLYLPTATEEKRLGRVDIIDRHETPVRLVHESNNVIQF